VWEVSPFLIPGVGLGDWYVCTDEWWCCSETVVATGSSVLALVCQEGDGGVTCVVEREVEVPFRVG